MTTHPADSETYPTQRMEDDSLVLCDYVERLPLGRDDREMFCDRRAMWWGAGKGKWEGRLVFACHRHRGMLHPVVKS